MSSYKSNCVWGNRGLNNGKAAASKAAPPKSSNSDGASVYDKALAGVQKHTTNVDETLLKVLSRNYAITQANADSAAVACGDNSEVETVVNNFAVNKLGMQADEALEAVKGICSDMAGSNHKNRIVFYYLLTKKVGKESVFV